MSSLPPPTGRPATMFPRPDPWAEQRRRQQEHRDEQRRRRRKWVIPLVVIVVVAVGGAGAVVVNGWVDGRRSVETVATTLPPPVTTVMTNAPATTLAPNELVEVDQVWLIDRGDGVFDWGVSVRTPPGTVTRSGVVIDVRLLDDDDDVVEAASGEVNGIGPESTGAVTGRLRDPSDVPVRLEFDVAVGVPSSDPALDDVLAVRGLARDSDVVIGRIRAESDEPIDDITMVLLWLDDTGDVVAAVPQPVDQVRPDVDARFEIDLDAEVVPDGRPDSVVWTR